MIKQIQLFENRKVRMAWNEEKEKTIQHMTIREYKKFKGLTKENLLLPNMQKWLQKVVELHERQVERQQHVRNLPTNGRD